MKLTQEVYSAMHQAATCADVANLCTTAETIWDFLSTVEVEEVGENE